MDMNISVRESKQMKKWLGVIYYNDTKANSLIRRGQASSKVLSKICKNLLPRIKLWGRGEQSKPLRMVLVASGLPLQRSYLVMELKCPKY
ncbi:MAG: hypothetical protein KAG61_01145, partial [Bacteriovoracaceae bacterium]|nr:hypothetical protein [Bacteriovoracaceae bacterium]